MSGSSEAGVTPEELIGHLQVIATWASVGSDPIYHGIEARRCGDVEKWSLEVIAMIRAQQAEIQTQQEEIRRLHEMVERLESFR